MKRQHQLSRVATGWVAAKAEVVEVFDDQGPDGIGGLSVEELELLRRGEAVVQPLDMQQTVESELRALESRGGES